MTKRTEPAPRAANSGRAWSRAISVATLLIAGLAAGASGQPASSHDQPGSTPAVQPATPGQAPANDPSMAEEKLAYVRLTTSLGDIVLELDREHAPISVENFLKYVEKGHYDGTVFHRVIKDFMIQGGGFTSDMKQKPTEKPIKNEWKNGLKNKTGTVAMARTSVPDSATSQFFINVKDNDFLDTPRGGAAYAVFGKVVGGMDVVEKIKVVPTGVKNGMEDVPQTPVVIEKAVKITREEASAPATPARDGATTPANPK